MTDLTDADRFELVNAQHYSKVQEEYEDATDSVSIDRWSKYGKDRLYLNGLKTGDGWISLKDGSSGGDRWTKVSADYELDGDELTIEVGKRRATYVITVKVHGDGFDAVDDEDDEDDQDDEEPEIAADGGRDGSDHIDERSIDRAREDPDHPDELTVEETRDILARIQESIEEYWAEWLDAIEHGDIEVVHEDTDAIVLADHRNASWSVELDEAGVTDEIDRRIISRIHHNEARRRCDYNWSASDPFVVRKPEPFDDGQRYVEAVMLSLMDRGLSPGQAWAYYGVEIRGNSRNSWAGRCGYSDHSAVSEPLRKAHEKIS